MHLKRIEIKGFKSFADMIHFPLSPGVTAFVGPNGCGKSNIVDAIRWTFGGRARSIRGLKMEDVLFTGNDIKSAAHHAEVSLVFNNKDRALDIPEEEVAIKREINADTVSKYSLNNVVCKAGDVKRLFEGMGIGSNSYSIIEQGKIGQILMANSEERRVIFEEAAGITGTLARIKETRQTLESTLQKLELVSVETDRLKKEKRKLEEQAKKAKKWKEYQQTLKAKQILLGRVKWRLFKERQKEAQHKIEELTQQKVTLEETLFSHNQALQELEEHVKKIREDYTKKDRRSLELGFELEQQQKIIQINNARIDELHEEIALKMEQNILLKQQIQVEETEWNTLEKDSGSFLQELELSRSQVEEQSIQLEDVQEKYQTLSNELNESRQQRFDDERRISELRNQKTALATNIQNIRAQIQRIEVSLTQKKEEKEILQEQVDEAQVKQTDLQKKRDEALKQWTETKKNSEELHQIQTQQKEKEQQNIENLYRVRSRLEVLRKLEEAHEGYQDGVVALQKNKLDGYLGLLLEHVSLKNTVDETLRPILDHFLQERVQYALFQDEETTLRALDFLKMQRQGQAHLVNRQHVSVSSDNNIPKDPNVLGALLHFLEITTPELAPLFEETLVVADRNTALKWINHWEGTILTREGEIFRKPGIFTGGKGKNEGIGLISRKSEIEQLEQDLKHSSTLQEELKTLVLQAQKNLTEIQQDLEIQQKNFQEVDQQVRDTQKDFNVLQHSFHRLSQECQQLSSEDQNLKLSLSGFEDQEDETEDEIDELSQEIAESETRVQQAEFELKQIQVVRDTKMEEFNQAKIQLAKAQEKQNNRETLLNHRRMSLQEKRQRLEQNDKDIQTLKEKIKNATALIQSAEENITQFLQHKEDSQSGLTEIRKQLEELEKRFTTQSEEKEQLAQKKQSLDDAYHKFALQAQEQEIKLQELYQRFVEDEMDPAELEKENPIANPVFSSKDDDENENEEETLEETPQKEEEVLVVSELNTINFKTLESEIQLLKRKIGKIGSVNLDSLKELEDVQERLKQQLLQQDDCVSAKEDIEKMLHELEETSRVRFRETYETVRKNFKEIFEVLFNGGYADIELDSGDELTAGIQILAKPPGKSPRNLNLLSGGEKTMTTIALLFAIFRSKPSPFCILDEVDAALDEENIERFVRMLVKQFVQHSQFIIITHRKPTMRIANTIYGITMQTAGISTRIAVDLENIENLLAEEPQTKINK